MSRVDHTLPPPAAPRGAALLVAAAASGQGKTTVTAALARLHARAGWRVRVFKCGPDFLDPYWLRLASGAEVHPLDLWMTGEADCRARLAEAAEEADLVLVEGVMGLYDGEPSAADVARRFGLPVLAVVDASAMAQSVGAVAHGLRHWQDARHGPLPWAGVLANRVGSPRHAAMLAQALGEQWLGALPREAAMALPERHLGLVAAHELPDALARLDAAANCLAQTPLGALSPPQWAARAPWRMDWHMDWRLERVQAAPATEAAKKEASTAGEKSGERLFFTANSAATRPPAIPPLLAGRTVAVARDAALSFIYDANVHTLQALGARVVWFSLLADAALPACDAVWLPGGYPELHAARLSANHALRDALRAHVAAGRPVWAECGGMMLLFEELVDKGGAAHPMWGLLPGRVAMQPRLVALGPQQLDLAPLLAADPGRDEAEELNGSDRGLVLRGHTFHHSQVHTPLVPAARSTPPGGGAQPAASGREGEALYALGPVRASYFHAWFASAPRAVAALLSPEPLALPPSAPGPDGGRA